VNSQKAEHTEFHINTENFHQCKPRRQQGRSLSLNKAMTGFYKKDITCKRH